jgi:hypothetical protein
MVILANSVSKSAKIRLFYFKIEQFFSDSKFDEKFAWHFSHLRRKWTHPKRKRFPQVRQKIQHSQKTMTGPEKVKPMWMGQFHSISNYVYG